MTLLDTQAWVWWTTGSSRLGPTARVAIARSTSVCISAVSIMEVSYAYRRGRLKFRVPLEEYLDAALVTADIVVIPLNNRIAQTAGQLDWNHGDPMDRAIVATAATMRIPLITSDLKIQRSGLVETLW